MSNNAEALHTSCCKNRFVEQIHSSPQEDSNGEKVRLIHSRG